MEELKNIELFQTINPQGLDLIYLITSIETYNKGNIVFYEGDEPLYFYILLKGSVKIYKVDYKGNEIVLHLFNAPYMIAEMASLEDFNFPASCVCLEDCKFALIKKEKFLQILKENSHISFEIIKSLTRKIKNMEAVVNRSLIFDATTKVAMYIDKDPEQFKTKKNKDIANELNISAETLSRVLKKLKDSNIIDTQLNLLDRDKLQMFINF
ncbi:MAG: Crp/Fnr family transcriptional regulator [Campylobacterales bacterium]|nr:Crp/Fnr family transcriptional regulator [Campylobacterales bacterium]